MTKHNKIALHGMNCKKDLLSGVKRLSSIVSETLGPGGRNIIISRNGEKPYLTKDGVSVVREFSVKDPIENIGVEIVKEVAIKANETAGDGTTTATVLAGEILEYGINYLEKYPHESVNRIKKTIDTQCEQIINFIDRNKIDIGNNRILLEKIAIISSNGDKNIGELISKAIGSIGKDGFVKVEESLDMKDSLEIIEGMQIDSGYASSHFITNKDKLFCELVNPLVILFNERLESIDPLVPVLEKCINEDIPLLIVAESYSPECMSSLLLNKVKNNLKCIAIKSPEYSNLRKDILDDIAVMTGGGVFDKKIGLSPNNNNIHLFLGSCKKVTSYKNRTVIMGGSGDKDMIEQHVESLKSAKAEFQNSSYTVELLQKRISKLSGGIAVIRVGGNSVIEIKEKRDRIDDALCACRSAIEDGVVAGGGIMLVHSLKELKNTSPDGILYHTISKPFEKILENTGVSKQDIETFKNEIINNDNCYYGYNCVTCNLENLLESGIIDPAKVVKSSLINACSVAGMLLTTEGVICEEENHQKLRFEDLFEDAEIDK